MLFECCIVGTRYHLNDLKDFKEDQKRGLHWKKFVNTSNRKEVFFVAIVKFIIGTILACFFNLKLFILAILFIVLQIFYDYYAKQYLPLISIATIAIAYPLRSLVIFYGLNIVLPLDILLLILLSAFFFAMFCGLNWRYYETLFFQTKGILKKPNSDFFISRKASNYIVASEYSFLFFFMYLIKILLDVKHLYIIFVILSLFLRLFFENIGTDRLRNITIYINSLY